MWLSPEISRSCIGAFCPAEVPWPRASVVRGLGSADPRESSLRLLQPEVHTHLPIHRRRGRQMLPSPSQVASPATKRPEPEVAVGHERAHAELLGEGERLLVVLLGDLGLGGIAIRVNLAEEPERPRLVTALLPVAGEGEGLPGD